MAVKRSLASMISMTRPCACKAVIACRTSPHRQQLDDFFKLWVFLSDDLRKPRRLHPGALELLERRAGFDGLMLAVIAYQQHTVLCSNVREKLVEIFRASE